MRWTTFVIAPVLAVMMALTAPMTALADGNVPVAKPPVTATDDQSVGVTVFVIHATNSRKGIDTDLEDYPELTRPPFSAYKSYQLLNKTSFTLDGTGSKIKLPDGGVFALRYLSKSGHKHLLQASITKKNGKKFLPSARLKVKNGQTFFIAGQTHNDAEHGKGIIVLGISLAR